MTQHNPLLTLAYNAGGTVKPNRFVKFGSANRTIVQAAAATDAIFGVSDGVTTGYLNASTGMTVDVHVTGPVRIVYGGTVTRGDLLVSDSDGRAITAAPAAGVNNRTGGVALVSGVVGDVGSVLINPGHVQGAT